MGRGWEGPLLSQPDTGTLPHPYPALDKGPCVWDTRPGPDAGRELACGHRPGAAAQGTVRPVKPHAGVSAGSGPAGPWHAVGVQQNTCPLISGVGGGVGCSFSWGTAEVSVHDLGLGICVQASSPPSLHSANVFSMGEWGRGPASSGSCPSFGAPASFFWWLGPR